MHPSTTLFYDTDTQRDFILPGGALAVPGADRIVPALAAVTDLGRRAGVRIAGSVDRHFTSDPELARSGGPYPDHCLDGSEGQRKIDATAPREPIWIENREYGLDELRAALSRPGEVIIEKQRLDVVDGNRNAAAVLDMLLKGVSDVVVYGVCTEFCVDLAVERLQQRGVRLHVPVDAVAALDPAEGERTLARWRVRGVRLTTVAEIERELAENING